MSKTITINFSEKEYMILNHVAEENTMTIQDFIRYKLAGTIQDLYDIFTPEEAVRRAIDLFSPEDTFTLSDIYGEDWEYLDKRFSPLFGRRFFNFISNNNLPIKYYGMVNRRATYILK